MGTAVQRHTDEVAHCAFTPLPIMLCLPRASAQ